MSFFNLINLKEIATASMVLFAVIDIIGSIPIIINLRQKVGHIESEKASVVALLIMIVFLFIGDQILGLIGIDVYSFAVAGSILIFFIAIEMILGIEIQKNAESKTASIVPIAFFASNSGPGQAVPRASTDFATSKFFNSPISFGSSVNRLLNKDNFSKFSNCSFTKSLPSVYSFSPFSLKSG